MGIIRGTTTGTEAGRTSPAISALTAALGAFCAGLVVVGMVLPGASDPSPETEFAALSPADPVKLVVPELDIRADVVPIGLTPDAVLDPPNDASTVGWWDGSARPGASSGQTVITGHTVHTGGGAMDSISRVDRGQKITVVTGEGRMQYRIQRVTDYDRETVAARSESLFGQDGGASGRLVLVTCTDWNGSFYERNVMVFARPLGEPVRLLT